MQQTVQLFSLSTCGHCKATKTLLNECEVRYDFTDVDLLTGKERTAILEDVKTFPIPDMTRKVIEKGWNLLRSLER